MGALASNFYFFEENFRYKKETFQQFTDIPKLGGIIAPFPSRPCTMITLTVYIYSHVLMRRFVSQHVLACVQCCGQDTQGRQMLHAAEYVVQHCAAGKHDPAIKHKQTCTALLVSKCNKDLSVLEMGCIWLCEYTLELSYKLLSNI